MNQQSASAYNATFDNNPAFYNTAFYNPAFDENTANYNPEFYNPVFAGSPAVDCYNPTFDLAAASVDMMFAFRER